VITIHFNFAESLFPGDPGNRLEASVTDATKQLPFRTIR
jgi:hypothetical protein